MMVRHCDRTRTLACQQEHKEVKWRPGQKPVWRPHIRTWDLSEAKLLYWRM